jgi:hypothetical protein
MKKCMKISAVKVVPIEVTPFSIRLSFSMAALHV